METSALPSTRKNSLKPNLVGRRLTAGTLPTMDPELLRGKIQNKNIMYNSKIDLWSIGVVFYYFLTGEYIFGYSTAEGVYKNIQKLQPKIKTGEFFEGFSPSVQDLLTQLLQVDPLSRIDWKDFFEHSIFKQPMYRELIIDDWKAGAKIISGIMMREDFDDNWKALNEEGPKSREVKSVPISFEISGINPSEVKQYKTWKSEIRFNVNSSPDIESITDTNTRMDVILKSYYHEVNKYVFVWYLREKSRYYSNSPLFQPVHRYLKKMTWVTLKQKLIRVKQIRQALFQGSDVIGFKDAQTHLKFLKTKHKIDLLFYFKKLEALYEEFLDSLEKEVNPKGRDSPKGAKLENILTLKSYQRHYWLKIYGNKPVNEALEISFIEKKAYYLFLLEVLYTMKLNLNFSFIDPNTNERFSWVQFNQKMKLMSLSSIQKAILILFKKYKMSRKKLIHFRH